MRWPRAVQRVACRGRSRRTQGSPKTRGRTEVFCEKLISQNRKSIWIQEVEFRKPEVDFGKPEVDSGKPEVGPKVDSKLSQSFGQVSKVNAVYGSDRKFGFLMPLECLVTNLVHLHPALGRGPYRAYRIGRRARQYTGKPKSHVGGHRNA